MKRLLSALLIMILIIPGTISYYPLKAKAEAGSSGILAYYNDAGEIVYDLNGLEGLDKDFAMSLYLVLDDAWVRYLEDPSQYFRVIVPPGTYFINPDTKSIRLGSNVTLELNGVNIICDEDDVIIQTKSRPSNKRDGIYAEEGVGGYDDYQNIKIVGGTIDLNSNSRVPIRFAHVTGLTLENLTVKNSAATHMVEIAACRDVYVTGCTFMDSIKEDPENMPLEAFQIDAANRETMSYSKDPVYDDCPCDNVEVAYCTFQNLYRGFGSHTVIPDVYQNNIRVHDCSFIDIENAAIMCTMWKDSNIYDNEYINVGKETDDTEYEWYTHEPSYMQDAE